MKGRLIEKIARTPTIESFRFRPERRIEFLPGQFLEVLFDPQHRGDREVNKYLSFSCSPAREYIQVTKRLSRSEFSRRLREMETGDEVFLSGPLGECSLSGQYKKTGFLIGGMGITPVISFLDYIAEKGITVDSMLFYSSRTTEEIAFKQEIDAWRKKIPALKVVYAVTDEPVSGPSLYSGRIDAALVNDNDREFTSRQIFIYGPPAMVGTMRSLAVELGCVPRQVHSEAFAGY